MNGWDGLLGYDIRLYERLLGEKVTNSHCGTQINNLTHARSIHLALYVCSVYVEEDAPWSKPSCHCPSDILYVQDSYRVFDRECKAASRSRVRSDLGLVCGWLSGYWVYLVGSCTAALCLFAGVQDCMCQQPVAGSASSC
jgi:hypothetical protein